MEKEWEYEGDAVSLLAAVIRFIVETELEKDGIWDAQPAADVGWILQ